MEINKLGVMPIFIELTKKFSNINMAVLTGSMFIIPKENKKIYMDCVMKMGLM